MLPGGELCGMRLQKLPRARDVPLSCTKWPTARRRTKRSCSRVCDRNTSPVALTASSSLSLSASSSCVAHRPGAGARAETDDAERHRCHPLEIGIGVDPLAEELCETDVLGECAANALGSKMTKNHPKFQRSEPAAELNAGIHQVARAARGLGRFQIFRHERKRLAHDVHAPAIERAEIERREQPLVRIHDDRSRRPPIRRTCSRYSGMIAVTPAYAASTCSQTLFIAADFGNRRDRIDAGRRRGADGGDDGDRLDAGGAVFGDRGAQRLGAACGTDRRPGSCAAPDGRGRAG